MAVPEGAVRNWTLGYDYLVVEEPSTWEEARQGCFKRRYGLASIISAEENAFIGSIVPPEMCKSVLHITGVKRSMNVRDIS